MEVSESLILVFHCHCKPALMDVEECDVLYSAYFLYKCASLSFCVLFYNISKKSNLFVSILLN